MRTIWKFEVKVEDRFELEMPRDAELLQVQMQNGTPSTRNTKLDYLGSFQLGGGSFVGHVFEEKR